jgi:hypothetical protein
MLGFGDVCGWHTLGQDIIPMANGWRKEVISSPRNNCRLMAAGAEKSCSDDPVDRIKDQNSSAINGQQVEKDCLAVFG